MGFKIDFHKDTSGWDQMKETIMKSVDKEILVGFFPDSVYGPENDNLPVAQVAQWQEEGVPKKNIPPRPFMRVGVGIPLFKRMKKGYYLESIKRIVEGKSTFEKEYTILGMSLAKDMKQSIEDWTTPKNSELTIKLKGFDDPLVETEKMKNSVEYRIERS